MTLRAASAVFLAIGLFVAGCGGGGTSVQGRVQVNGKPLEQAKIEFVPMASSGGDQVGTVVSQGEYLLEDSPQLKPGDYQVQIRAYRGTGKKVWDGMGDGTNKNMVEDTVQFIPNKYNDASELKVTINSGANTYDANLEVPE